MKSRHNVEYSPNNGVMAIAGRPSKGGRPEDGKLFSRLECLIVGCLPVFLFCVCAYCLLLLFTCVLPIAVVECCFLPITLLVLFLPIARWMLFLPSRMPLLSIAHPMLSLPVAHPVLLLPIACRVLLLPIACWVQLLPIVRRVLLLPIECVIANRSSSSLSVVIANRSLRHPMQYLYCTRCLVIYLVQYRYWTRCLVTCTAIHVIHLWWCLWNYGFPWYKYINTMIQATCKKFSVNSICTKIILCKNFCVKIY